MRGRAALAPAAIAPIALAPIAIAPIALASIAIAPLPRRATPAGRSPAAHLAIVALVAAACDPYRDWPDPTELFPYVYTPEDGLPDYAAARWETETWDPGTDLDMAGLYVLKAQNHRPSAPIESLDHFAAMRAAIPPPGAGVRLDFVGDIMYIGDNWDRFAAPVTHLFDGDYAAGNLETPVSPDHPTDRDDLGLYEFNAPTAILDGLPFDLLQVTNNHSMDVGEDGLASTLAEVDARGFVRTGEGAAPVVDIGGTQVAFLSYTWGLNGKPLPSGHDLHVVPFGHLGEDIDLSSLEADIAAVRDRADTVVVMPHWGYEYEYYPDPQFLVLGRRMIEAGADLVIGSGPHTAQPVEWCYVNRPEFVPDIGLCSLRTPDGEPRDAAILYSLGNFDTMQPTLPLQAGLLATATWDGGLTGLGWKPVVTVLGDDGREVQPLEGLAGDYAVELARLRDHLGEGWMR